MIVYWTDGTKTVVKCNENDEYSEYAGFVAAVAKKMYGGANAINRLIDSKKSFMAMAWVSHFVRRKHSKRFLMKLLKKPLKNMKSFLLIL